MKRSRLVVWSAIEDLYNRGVEPPYTVSQIFENVAGLGLEFDWEEKQRDYLRDLASEGLIVFERRGKEVLVYPFFKDVGDVKTQGWWVALSDRRPGRAVKEHLDSLIREDSEAMDVSYLSFRTRGNLEKLEKMGFTFEDVAAKASVLREGGKVAYSYIIPGTSPEGSEIYYVRRETASPQAGQTYIIGEDFPRTRVSKILEGAS